MLGVMFIDALWEFLALCLLMHCWCIMYLVHCGNYLLFSLHCGNYLCFVFGALWELLCYFHCIVGIMGAIFIWCIVEITVVMFLVLFW